MSLGERFGYAIIAAFCGALLGIACWWLYGQSHSLAYDGPGLDPVLRHWVACLAAVFALLGLIFGARAGELVGDVWSAIFHFEWGDTPNSPVSLVFALVFIALVIAAVWFTVPA